MHKYHEQAEAAVRDVIKQLECLLPRDGEDISYYNPGIMADPIRKLIGVQVLLACANEAKGANND